MRFICTWMALIMATYVLAQDLYVYAGEDITITSPQNQVQLTARIDGDSNLNSRWKQVSGPSRASIATPKELATTVNKLEVGTYEFEFSVFFRDKIYGSDIVAVTVQSPKKDNQPPVANAGDDVTITLPQNSLSIDGSATDSDGKLAYVQWTKISGPSITVDQDGTLLILSNMKAGRYQFELHAIDDAKGEDRDEVIVIVNPENEPPKVNAGNNLTIILPNNSTTLAGSATDDNNAIASYRWRQTSGPSTASIASPTRPTTRIGDLIEGSYRFELVVYDRQEASGSDDVVINVRPEIPSPENTPPTANAGPNQTIQLPKNTVNLAGRGRDEDGTITSFFWKQTEGPNAAALSNDTSALTNVTGLIAGTYQFELFVTDNGQKTDRDVVQVLVLPADSVPDTPVVITNFPPIAKAGPDITITSPGVSVTLQAEMADPEGKPIIFTWKQKEGPQTTNVDTLSQFNPTQSDLPEGTYVFELIVTDDQGLTSADTVTIVLAVPPPPINWPLIAVIALGVLGGVVASSYFFFWVPGPKKVMVYYLDKAEEIFVDSIMPNAEKTESFSVGNSKSSDIKKLKDKNIAVHVLNTNHLVVNTPGRIQTYDFSKKKGFKRNVAKHYDTNTSKTLINLVGEEQQRKTKSVFEEFPVFYIITLDGPLLPTFENQLLEKGIQIIRRVPVNSYVLRISNTDQLHALNDPQFQFIRMKQPYTPQDTGITVRGVQFQYALQADEAIILDLLLHRDEDMSEVKQYLERLQIEIMDWYRNRIRIRILAASISHLKLAQHPCIQAIYEYIPPVWNNDVSRLLIGIDKEIAGQSTLKQTGDGEIIGVADTGIDQRHVDLKDQLIKTIAWGRKETNDTSDPHGHGTHVAGSIAGSGAASSGKIKGMAPGAKLVFQSLLTEDKSLCGFGLRLHELFKEAYEAGARIHNNSWGSAAEGRYTIDTEAVDEFIHDHPEMLIVFSAGNEGCSSTISDTEKGYVGFGTVGSPATTKNGLTVGASRNKRTQGGYASKTYGTLYAERFPFPPTSMELISGDPEAIAAYSSRGQCDDNRMKPDIVAPGTDILSARSQDALLEDYHGGFGEYKDAYAFLGGTSMAAPIVAGAAALVREYYKKERNCKTPSAALIKATLINGTRKLTGESAIHLGDIIPNPNQGFGMLDLLYTIPNSQQNFLLNFHDSLTDPKAFLRKPGQIFKSKVQLNAASWIRVCLTFTDKPDRYPQSDLDLMIEYAVTKQKWSGNRGINGQDPYQSKVEDRTNNLEIIRIDVAQPGLYTVCVSAYAIKGSEQGFAMVITTGDTAAKFG